MWTNLSIFVALHIKNIPARQYSAFFRELQGSAKSLHPNSRVGNSFFRSKSCILQSYREKFDHVALYKIVMWVIRSKKSYFCMFLAVFVILFPFLCPRANHSRCSSLSRSRHSLQKRNCERFAPIAYDKRATGVIHSFSRANRYFAILLTQTQWFTQKTSYLLEKPMSKVSTLRQTNKPLSSSA